MQIAIDVISYACGMVFNEFELLGWLNKLCVNDHKCYNHIEKLNYSREVYVHIVYRWLKTMTPVKYMYTLFIGG